MPYLRADEAKNLDQGTDLLVNHTDVTGAEAVEVHYSDDATTLWVNVNGICLLRICRIKQLIVGSLPRNARSPS